MSETNKTEGEGFNDPRRESRGFAVAAFVISLVNMILFGSMLSIICVPLSLIFAIITLVEHRRGKRLSIIAIVVSAISAIIFIRAMIIAVRIYPDIDYFLKNDRQIIDEYNETGEIPDRFVKYEATEYDRYWESVGYDSFDDFFAWFVSEYEKRQLSDEDTSVAAIEDKTAEVTTGSEKAAKKDDDTLVRLT